MLLIMASTMLAMVSNLAEFWASHQWILLGTGAVIFALAVWLAVEAVLAVRLFRRQLVTEGLEVEFNTATIANDRLLEEET